jgi:hypothetical protein
MTKRRRIFVEGKRVGGYDALREFLGKRPDPDEGDSYQPIIAVVSVALGMAVMTGFRRGACRLGADCRAVRRFQHVRAGILKLQNLQSFATGFVQYDLLARRYVPYAYLHTFIEAVGGVLMIGEIATLVIAPAVLFVSTVGAGSVFKAMYLEKRDVNCACVGGSSRVPGFVSLTENLL